MDDGELREKLSQLQLPRTVGSMRLGRRLDDREVDAVAQFVWKQMLEAEAKGYAKAIKDAKTCAPEQRKAAKYDMEDYGFNAALTQYQQALTALEQTDLNTKLSTGGEDSNE